MSVYRHPYKEADFVIRHLLAFDDFCRDNALDELNSDFFQVVLTEAEKFAAKYLVEQNRQGDLQPARLIAGKVVETPGFASSYRAFVEQGWSSLSASEQYGGQGLPNILSVACNEIWQSANLAFSLCPLLGQGAITAIERHGSRELKQQYLKKLISGEWTGTMNLTEAGAGSDLAAIKTRAVPEDDHYKIYGQKIFITWGDHQMSDNIIHLVLARLPDAPAGVKGLSLFVVPKYLLDEQGQPGIENDLRCISLEHKLGIHASPTCVMSYGDENGAIGYVIGENNYGLHYMFSMMNHARQGVGVQGLGVSERAYQVALEYAGNRVQGTDKAGNSIRIIEFGDVRRMLMLLKSATEAMRALCYYAGFETDKKNAAADNSELARQSAARIDFLTPIVKGWCTELTQELVSLAMQIHGGAGYIEEAGVAQLVRDARILTIYEGTTGIQALDLVKRKTLLDDGAQAGLLFAEIEQTLTQLEKSPGCEAMYHSLNTALADGRAALNWLQVNPTQSSCVAAYYLQLWGYLTGGWLMAKSQLIASTLLDNESSDSDYLQAKLVTAKFYAEHFLVRTNTCLASIEAGGDTMMSLSEQQFFSHVN
ncbi:MAG: acyl-CoA dehydrogenase [Pseudomonadales bacterium]|nr:acyl-CoA dehydrogenase [Pseudomonadales bacterium]NRA16317.1 acyl-CoA dehydrogenase [Oceanospirillaceae bacterium]